VVVELTSAPPAPAGVRGVFDVFVSTLGAEADTFLIQGAQRAEGARLKLDLRDVHPRISASAEQQLTLFAQRVAGELLDRLVADVDQALRDGGF
jgi:hypothetical protein